MDFARNEPVEPLLELTEKDPFQRKSRARRKEQTRGVLDRFSKKPKPEQMSSTVLILCLIV